MRPSALENLNHIAQVIFDKKGFNILALEVKKISSIADYLLIAEGNVDRHVISLARAVEEAMGSQHPLHVEGLESGDWVVIDFGDIIVHLFQPGLRDKYALEKLWRGGDVIDLEIDVASKSKD